MENPTHGCVGARGSGLELKCHGQAQVSSRKQKQDVSGSQGMAKPILRSEVQDARSSGSPPLFFLCLK